MGFMDDFYKHLNKEKREALEKRGTTVPSTNNSITNKSLRVGAEEKTSALSWRDDEIAPVREENSKKKWATDEIAPVKETDWGSVYQEAVRLQTEATNSRVGLHSKKGKAYQTQKANADSATEKLNNYLKSYGFSNIDELKTTASEQQTKKEATKKATELNSKWGKYKSASDYSTFSVAGESKRKDVGLKFWEDRGDDVYDYINDIGDYRKFTAAMTNNSQAYDDYKKFDYLTDDEKGIYNYLYAKEGKDKANEYLKDIEGYLQARYGQDSYDNMSTARKSLYWLGGGLENWAQNTKQFFSDDAIPQTRTQYANELVKKEAEEHSYLLGNLYTAGESVANQIPNIILTKGAGALAGGLGVAASTATKIGQAVGAASIFTSSAGGAYGQALEEGKTKEEARTYSTIVGALEAGLQTAIGGISAYGGVSESALMGKVALIENTTLRMVTKYGVQIGAEIGEEELQLWLEPLARTVVFGEEYDAPEIEEMVETAFVTAISTGVLNSASNIAEGTKVNGMSVNEAKVVDKVYKNAIAEQETDGKKLTSKEKSKLYDDIVEKMDKGDIEIDTIEEVLGGKTYEEYKSITEKEKSLTDEISQLENLPKEQITVKQSERLTEAREELKNFTNKAELKTRLSDEVYGIAKDSRLVESYNEKARKSQAFEADLTKYTGKKREAIERAVKSGVLNNTNKSHALVDTLSNIEADKDIIFDYADNKKLVEYGFAIKGKTVNGFEKNGTVTLNVQSAKSWQSTVGHEITHVLEGTDAYSALQETLFKVAESKGELETRRANLTELYKDIDADIDKELTADLVGDYLFSDKDFIKGLTTNKNLFQRVYDEIKYLCKVATGKELTEIEKVRREFDKVWKEFNANTNAEADGKVNLSVSETTDGNLVAVVDNDILKNIDTTSWDKEKKETAKKAASNALKQFKEGIVVNGITHKVNKTSRQEYTRSNYTESLYNKSPDVFADKMRAADIADDIVVATTNWTRDGNLKHPRNDNFVDFDRGTTLIMSGDAKYKAEVVVGITKNGEAVLYDVVDMTPTTFETKKAETSTTVTTQNAIDGIQEISAGDIVTENGNDVKTNFSLSADSNGKQLSKEQQKYFKDSKILDENGNLKVMYHGTPEAFTVFDKKKAKSFGTYGNGFYFSDSNSHAGTYGETLSVYLNITNPLKNGTNDITKEQLRKFVEAIAEDEDYGIENYGYGATVDSVVDSVYGKEDFGKILDLNITCIGNMVEAVELFNKVNGTDYNGIVAPTETVAFYPNQIKNIDNTNPTENPDITLSLSKQGEQIAPVGNYSTPLNETALAPMREDVVNTTPKTVADNAMAEDIAPMPTDADAPPVMETEYYNTPDTTAVDEKTLNNIGKSLRETLSLTTEETKAIQAIVQEYSTSEMPNREELFNVIKEKFGEKYTKIRLDDVADVKRVLRDTKLYVSDNVKADIPNYSKFRKSIGSKIKTSKNGLPIDVFYQELAETYPDFFKADFDNPTDQFMRICEVAEMPIYENEFTALNDSVIQEAVDIISNEVVNYKNTLNRSAAEDTAREVVDSIAPSRAEQLVDGSRGDALLNQSLDNHPVQTVEDKINETVRAVKEEIADNQVLRRESIVKIDKEIERLANEYLAKRDKNTQVANKLVSRIAKLQDNKTKIDANYAKRISDLEARLEKMQTPKYNKAMHKKAKMQEYADWAKELIGNTKNWVDKKLGLQYQTNTERRNLRDIVRDENGKQDIAKADKINDELNGQYNREEAALKKELAQIRKKYADLKITKHESEYIQMLGELRGNPETELTEKAVNEYYEKHKNKIDTAKVEKVIELARQDYDNLLKRVNEKLREQGMKEIPYRQGYFPHFTVPKQNFVQKLLNWKTQDNEIPTSIAGLTEDFKPVKSWQAFDKTRHSDTTDYNFLMGFDNYSKGALDWIYHIETLQKRRAVENYIRYTHSDEGIKSAIKEVYADENLDADEAQAKIEGILAQAKNPLNNFVQDFMTHTNILAGKKNSLDRTAEQSFNRKIYNVMMNVQNRTSANMVLANVRSALTNFIPITQSWAQVSPLRSLQATKDTIANAIKDDGMVEKSTFLTNRLREVDNLYNTTWDKVIDKAGIMFEIVDNFSSQVIWRSKYNDNLAKGMNENEAIANADQFAENVMAGRSKGNEPTIFNAKNPFVKAFTMFQLEVNNQYGYLFKDVPNDLKAETNHWKLNLAKGYTTAFVGAYVYNALLEQVAGSGAALDPIGIIEDLLKDLGLFGDDDEEEDVVTALSNFRDNVVEELPFVGGLYGGGRIPITSAIPYNDKGLSGGLDAFTEDMSKTFKAGIDSIKEGDIHAGDWSGFKNFLKELENPFFNVGLPVGGGQIKKTIQGLSMFNTDEDHPIAGSYTDSGALRFPVDDTLGNRIQAGIFGQYASKNAREYFDNGYAPLKEKQIQEYMDVDLPIADYWKYRDGLKGLKSNAEKADYINSLDIKDWQKNLLMNNILDRKEDVDMSNYDDFSDFEEFDFAQKNPEKYEFFKANNISYDYYSSLDEDGKAACTWAYNNPEKYKVSKLVTDNVVTYRSYTSDLYDIKADKDANGDTIVGSAKEKKVDYINNLDLEYEQKIILFKMQYKSDDTYNADIINYLNNREDLSYDERVAIYTELGFKVKNGYVYWD